jgi:hypothetical protein
VDVLDELLGGFDSVFGFDHPGVIHHLGDIVALGFFLFKIHEGVHRLVGFACLLHTCFDMDISFRHFALLESVPVQHLLVVFLWHVQLTLCFALLFEVFEKIIQNFPADLDSLLILGMCRHNC